MRSILAALVLLLVSFGQTTAQDVVVSEYRNSTEQDTEWTEIVVVADNVDLRGYIITDNRGGGDMRQSGPRFKNIPFWQHMRAGTIILISHGPVSIVQNLDEDPADGYLELSQYDLNYFEIVNVEAAPGSNGMNINQDRDFVQIFRPDTTHVHGLMHGRPAGATWDNTPDPKVGYDTTNIGPRSVCVSGRSLAAYRAGRNNDSTSTGRHMSPGLPNKVDDRKQLNGLVDVNYLLWQEWREPEWSAAPSITVLEQTPARHVIEWTPMIDPYPADGVSGYLVWRDTNDFVSFPADAIVDGKLYAIGAKAGTAELIGIVTTQQGQRFTDTRDLRCGTSYTYRVYAYRFGADDQLGQPDPTTARGRQYQPTFAQSARVLKPNPPKPLISASRMQICPGDTVTLTTNAAANIESFQWTINGFPVTAVGFSPLVVSEVGTYRLTITAAGGCSSTSDALTITALPAPEVEMQPTGAQTICQGDTLLLRSTTAAPRYEWRRNGVAIPGATSATYAATQDGDYQVLIENQAGCPGVSKVTRIRIPDIRFSFEPALVDFGILGACQSSAVATVDLLNTGADAITVSQISMPTGFALAAPAPGFSVQPGERVTLTLLFAPSGIGVTTGTATFRATPCNVAQTLQLRGERQQGEVSLNKAGIDFGVFTACPTSDLRVVDSISLVNSGTGRVRIGVPLVFPPFYILRSDSKDTLEPGESFTVVIQYRPLGADLDRGRTDVIGFPFSSASCRDTLQATLQAAAFFPRVSLVEADLGLGFVLGCVGSVDTVLAVQNTSPVDATIAGNTSANVLLIGAPVQIPAGETRTIPVRISPPAGVGGFVVRDTLLGQACDQRLPIRYSGNWFAGTFAAAPTPLDLPTVDLCNGPDSSTATFVITASQTNGLRAPVTAVSVGAPFNVDLAVGTTIISDLTVTVTYRPTIAGVDRDTVVVVFGPCSDTVRVVVRGQADRAARTTVIDDPDFGTLQPGQTTQRRVVITNTGQTGLPVAAPDGVNPPFSIVGSQPALPAVIAPGDSVVITLAYTYTGPGRTDQTTLTTRTSGACADTVRTALTGSTMPSDPIDGLVIVIPENLTARVGDAVDVPVSLTAPASLQGAGLQQVTVYLRYNGSIFKPESATGAAAGVSAAVAESTPGVAQLTLSAAELLEASPIAVIRGRTYLGGARATPIAIDSVVSNLAAITGDDGQLSLVGDCAVETQVIALGLPAALQVVHVQDRVIELDVTTLTDDATVLRVVDVRGAVLRTEHLVVRPGLHRVRLALPQAAAGVALVQMIHGRWTDSRAVLIAD